MPSWWRHNSDSVCDVIVTCVVVLDEPSVGASAWSGGGSAQTRSSWSSGFCFARKLSEWRGICWKPWETFQWRHHLRECRTSQLHGLDARSYNCCIFNRTREKKSLQFRQITAFYAWMISAIFSQNFRSYIAWSVKKQHCPSVASNGYRILLTPASKTSWISISWKHWSV